MFRFVLSILLLAGVAGAEMKKTSTGLQYEDEKVGTGVEAISGKDVDVHYTGWLNGGQ